MNTDNANTVNQTSRMALAETQSCSLCTEKALIAKLERNKAPLEVITFPVASSIKGVDRSLSLCLRHRTYKLSECSDTVNEGEKDSSKCNPFLSLLKGL